MLPNGTMAESDATLRKAYIHIYVYVCVCACALVLGWDRGSKQYILGPL